MDDELPEGGFQSLWTNGQPFSRGLFLRSIVEASRDPGGNGVLGFYRVIILAFPPFPFLTLVFQSHLPNESHLPKTLPQALLSGNVY